jgi:hypothetical protein
MGIKIDLQSAWNDFAEKGLIKNIFTDSIGRKIEAGVHLGGRGPEAYAVEISSGKNVCEPYKLTKLASGVEVLFNPVGALKPQTLPSSIGKQESLPADPAACRLECQNSKSPLSILNRRPLLEVSCVHRPWRAYPNVAPWEPRGVIIWLPLNADGTLPHLAQALTRDDIEDFLQISRGCKNMGTFFNSQHGGASANHLHFQSVFLGRKLAVELAGKKSAGGYSFLTDYPAAGLVFDLEVPVDILWSAIDKIQRTGYPFNLIALSSGIFLFARNSEHETLQEFPGRTFGAINFAGLFISTDAGELAKVDDKSIALAYKKMTIGGEALAKLLK